MADIEYYLDYIKDKDEKKVELLLDEKKLLSRIGAKRTPKYKKILKQFETGEGLEVKEVTKSKKEK